MEKNIYVRITGGLGNQMFQYATALSVAHQLKCPMTLDTSFYKNQALRHYDLKSSFLIETPIISPLDLSFKFFGINIPILRKFVRAFNSRLPLKKRKIYTERGLGYNAEIFSLSPGSLLIGYWQSPFYFSSIRQLIIDAFDFSSLKNDVALLELKNLIMQSHGVSIHFRRGDYVSDATTNKIHGICSVEYYSRAVNYIKSRSDEPIHLFVFSDDIDWCRENIKYDIPMTFVGHTSRNNAADMYLMSLCRHNIIANSTYSWWGAWLNRNSQKLVIAPQKWFNDPAVANPDIYPEGWILI